MLKIKDNDLNDIRKYLDLRKQYTELEKDLEKRLKDTIDMNYGEYISGFENHDVEIDKEGNEYISFDDNCRAYKQTEGHFVYQATRWEDDFYGSIFYPTKDDEYLRIDF